MNYGIMKRALIRDSSVPMGTPAPLYVECCGNRLEVELAALPIGGVVCPDCRNVYDRKGFVIAKA